MVCCYTRPLKDKNFAMYLHRSFESRVTKLNIVFLNMINKIKWIKFKIHNLFTGES